MIYLESGRLLLFDIKLKNLSILRLGTLKNWYGRIHAIMVHLPENGTCENSLKTGITSKLEENLSMMIK